MNQSMHGFAGVVTDSLDRWDIDGFEESGVPSRVDHFLDSLAGASKAQQITAGGAAGW